MDRQTDGQNCYINIACRCAIDAVKNSFAYSIITTISIRQMARCFIDVNKILLCTLRKLHHLSRFFFQYLSGFKVCAAIK